jgi:hypothetical protein
MKKIFQLMALAACLGGYAQVVQAQSWLASASNLYFNGGNVGIGTATPTAKLEVVGGGWGTVDFKVNGRVKSGDANNTGGYWAGDQVFMGQASAPNTFGVWTGSVDWAMVINGSRNVGIGTTSPTTRLQVQGQGGHQSDIVVNGRIKSGDATNQGGLIAGNSVFMGQAPYDPNGFTVWTNGDYRMVINSTGNVGIGTHYPGNFKLAVEGVVGAREIKVQNTAWADHVFDSAYQLMPLDSVAAHIRAKGHLPGLPSQAEVEAAGGVPLGQTQVKLLEKIEELTLYLLELKKQNAVLQRRVDILEAKKE